MALTGGEVRLDGSIVGHFSKAKHLMAEADSLADRAHSKLRPHDDRYLMDASRRRPPPSRNNSPEGTDREL